MPVSLDLYSADLGEPGSVTWGPLAGTIVGSWLVVVHQNAGGQLADMGGDPDAANEWPPGAWQLLCQADAGPGNPKTRIWAAQFPDLKERRVTLDAPDTVDCHTKLYYLSGTRPGADAADVFFPGTASSSASGASQAVPVYSPDTAGLLIGAWISGAVLNYSSLGGLTAEAEVDAASSTSRSGEVAISAAGPATRTATASVAAPWAAASILVRADPGGSVTFPAQPLRMKTEIALGADPGADPATWAALWTDITADAQPRDGGVLIVRGRGDEASRVPPSKMNLTLDNTAGRYARLNPLGPYYGQLSKNTPIQHWADYGLGWNLRYRGFVSEFPPRSQGGQVDEHMPIEANGPMRRLGRGKVLASPLFRAITAHGAVRTAPYSYWPLETGPSSGVPGGPAMKLTGPVTFGDGGPAGAIGTGTFDVGTMASSPVVMPTTSSWQVSFWLEIPADSVDSSPIVGWLTPGAIYSEWFAYVNSGQPGKVAVEVFDPGVDEVFIIGTQDIRGMGPVLVTVRASQQSGQVYISLSINNVRASADFTFATSDFVFPISGIGINNLVGLDAAHGVTSLRGTVDHLYVASETAASDDELHGQLTWLLAAGQGYAGERATDRIRRLGAEENVPVAIVGDDGRSEPMGPQPVARFLDLLRDCEATDGGMLYEQRDARLAYQARAGRYNARVALTLDYAAGHVAPPLEPTDDDQHLLNDFTASRNGGGTARVLNQTHKEEVGEYADSATLNVAGDDQLADQAGWRVHQGTADDLRYPALVPNLNGRPALIPDWAGLDVGQAGAITNPGRDLPPGQIDAIVEGYQELLDTASWTAEANCSPGKPWKVIALGHDTLGRLDTAGSILGAAAGLPAATSTIVEDFEDASLAVTITGGGILPWARSADRAHAGGWSLKSGAITHNQTSDAIVTVPGGKTICTFWYYVSSEATFDFFRVLVDAVEQFAVSGESVGWQRGAVVVTGASTVTFRYAKDAAVSEGDDAVYVDDLTFTTAETISVATKTGPGWTTAPRDMPFDITAAGEQMSVLAAAAPATMNANPGFESGTTGWAGTGGTFTTVAATIGSGSLNGRITPTGSAATVQVKNSTHCPVIPGVSYTFTAVMQCALARSVDLRAIWLDASNAFLANNIITIAVPAGAPVTFSGTFAAPAGAASVDIAPTMTGTPPATHVLLMDDVTITGVQTMTVVRAVNGVAKAHSVGEDVRLATPPILSL
jgi:hypothetical protein